VDSNSAKAGSTTIPSELTGPLPRKVRGSSGGIQSAFFAAAVVALALAGTSWMAMRGVHEFQNRAALRSDGIETTGQVTGFLHPGSSGKTLVANYSFTVNGLPFTGKGTVPEVLRRDLNESSNLSIRYLPANPAVNHPADWEEPPFSAVVPLMFPILPVAVGIMMLMFDHKERHLLAEGLPAIATITESRLYGSRAHHYWQYEFRTRDGDIHPGMIPFDDSQQVGESFCVIYLPQNPRRNLPYPLFDYRIDQ
jgi:hypothetical protein